MVWVQHVLVEFEQNISDHGNVDLYGDTIAALPHKAFDLQVLFNPLE